MQDRHVLDKYIELYDILNSSTMTDIENAVKQTVAGMYKNVTGQSLIEDTGKSVDFTGNIGEIITDINKLRQETYKVGHGEIEINRVAKDILVFNTLDEAIVTLEQSNIADGAYVSYINLNDSNESYFAIMLKSNGWLASWNDRIDEVYYGQHEVLSTRNNRWASDKKDSLFPYDSLLDYSNHDSKGCATTFKIKDEYVIDEYIHGKGNHSEHKMIDICQFLAVLEHIVRDNTLDEIPMIGQKACDDIKYELLGLIEAFKKYFVTRYVGKNSRVVYNPTFTCCGYADADIWVDGCLYDFKTTKNIGYNENEVKQLWWYVLLHAIDKRHIALGTFQSYDIDSMALYKARCADVDKVKLNKEYVNNCANELEQLLRKYRLYREI